MHPTPLAGAYGLNLALMSASLAASQAIAFSRTGTTSRIIHSSSSSLGSGCTTTMAVPPDGQGIPTIEAETRGGGRHAASLLALR
jgi:hypothetical protein